eukprot:gene17816-18043_t
MQPVYSTLNTILSPAVQHSVPLFQRPYVWTEEKNWKPLWEDLSDLGTHILTTTDGSKIRSHFLGTVVLAQLQNASGTIPSREVIDGQQRLTTLQLVFQAVLHVFAEIGKIAKADGNDDIANAAHKASIRLGALTKNAGFEEDAKYKVWPTNDDRIPFCQVMEANSLAELHNVHSRMADAYRYFLSEVRKWIGGKAQKAKIVALESALREHLKLVVLDLDQNDEPQAIFETLNAHGTPLLPADLIKNWLLWEGKRNKLPLDKLYSQYWGSFDHDHDFWRAEVGTGHAARARIDTFLQNWLTMRCREPIAAKHLYDRFVKLIEPQQTDGEGTKIPLDVEGVMQTIYADAKWFRRLVEPKENTRFDKFLRRLSTMSLVVFHPFLLALMARQASDQADRDQIAKILESYLVRRMVCDEDTRGYGTLNIALLNALDHAGDEGPASGNIHTLLSQVDSNTIKWNDDAEFEAKWLARHFYGGLRRDRVVMLLQAIEGHYHAENSKSEPIIQVDYEKLQVEHILPQKWQEHWSVEGEEAVKLRNSKINTIGNLTLVSNKLNPSLSNGSWLASDNVKKGKRAALEDDSMLRLNARLVKEHPEDWNEQTIDARAKALFESGKGYSEMVVKIETPHEFCQYVVDRDVAEFKANPIDLRIAYHACISLLSLRDWVLLKYKGKTWKSNGSSQGSLTSKAAFQKALSTLNPAFDRVVDNANASKHMILNSQALTQLWGNANTVVTSSGGVLGGSALGAASLASSSTAIYVEIGNSYHDLLLDVISVHQQFDQLFVEFEAQADLVKFNIADSIGSYVTCPIEANYDPSFIKTWNTIGGGLGYR